MPWQQNATDKTRSELYNNTRHHDFEGLAGCSWCFSWGNFLAICLVRLNISRRFKKKKCSETFLFTVRAWAHKVHFTTQASVAVVEQLVSCVSIRGPVVRLVWNLLFSHLTGDFDASELSDGEQNQVCSCRLSLNSISVFSVYTLVVKNLKTGKCPNMCFIHSPMIFDPGRA